MQPIRPAHLLQHSTQQEDKMQTFQQNSQKTQLFPDTNTNSNLYFKRYGKKKYSSYFPPFPTAISRTLLHMDIKFIFAIKFTSTCFTGFIHFGLVYRLQVFSSCSQFFEWASTTLKAADEGIGSVSVHMGS